MINNICVGYKNTEPFAFSDWGLYFYYRSLIKLLTKEELVGNSHEVILPGDMGFVISPCNSFGQYEKPIMN